jgi:hypothetical protein
MYHPIPASDGDISEPEVRSVLENSNCTKLTTGETVGGPGDKILLAQLPCKAFILLTRTGLGTMISHSLTDQSHKILVRSKIDIDNTLPVDYLRERMSRNEIIHKGPLTGS